MKKIIFILCLCAALLLLSCCGYPSFVDMPDDGQKEMEGKEAAEAQTVEEELRPSRDFASAGQVEEPCWESAFWDEISQAKTAELNAGMTDASVSYALYDMDKDGIPELLIRVGDCEANYEGRIYCYADGSCRLLGSVGLGHGSFWTDPEREGLIVAYGHMGSCSALRIWFDEGGLQTEALYQMDLNEHPELREFPKPADYVDGSVRIPEMSGKLDLPLKKYEQISMWLDSRADFSENIPSYPDGDSEFYSRLISEDGVVYAVSADDFSNTPGEVHFSELLKEDVIYPYMRSAVQPGEARTVDRNGDGSMDYMLPLHGDGDDYMIILSAEDGVVYAYLFFCPPHFDAVDRYGTFLSEENGPYAFRYVFEGDQCLQIEVPASLFTD